MMSSMGNKEIDFMTFSVGSLSKRVAGMVVLPDSDDEY